MIAAMRAGDELDSRALVHNLLALLNQCLDKARQLVEKYEDSLSTGKPADDITDWHIFEIEVVKVRSLAEEYLEKDSVTDNRRDTTPNRGDTTNFITSSCLSGNFQSLTETFRNSRHSGNSLKIKYTDSQNFEIPPDDKERNVERDYGDFRPVGISVTVLVKAKRMLQVLWRKGIDWDTPLPQNMLKDWRNWIAEIPSISEIRLPRCWLPAETDCIKEVELHGYGDVSEMAYGSAVYLRVTTISGETVVKLVMSKTRIAPVKRVTVPRLKLMAALITARLIAFVKTSLEMKFSKVAYWTDSQIALRWIQGDSYRWKSFVGNRVESILELTDAQWWRHCSTTDNPADILTRGCRMKDLVSNNLWWHGPHWLTKCEDAGPMAKFELAIDRNPKFQAEVGKSAPYVFRFITNCKAVPEERKTTPLDVREIDQAEKFWLKALQNEKYQEDLESLKQEKKLPKSSILWPLNPCVDDNGILRALDRFFARRGQSKIIQSDNFTSFKEIGRNLNELVLETHRRKPLGKTSLDEEKLATVLCGIEAQVNACPLTFVGDDSFARCALRPKSSWTNDGYRRTANKALELQKEEPKVGDVVLIAEDDVNKGRWMTGRVLELFHGRDGVVRSIRLKVAKGEITRPSKKLRLLEPAVIDGDLPSLGEDVADSNRRKKPERQ
ncbi:hypothetical protein T4E_1061 [Trichinella pseudospiralis]|uniref:DUF5641 domain-containing protein n=1 Tax=Trichinella pseudospiralis TaxID=6337 RepID=A0A0V0XGA6_TRIPS|nr:hypothetical protein T4E_1061 [Trichinella pseudospiralis]